MKVEIYEKTREIEVPQDSKMVKVKRSKFVDSGNIDSLNMIEVQKELEIFTIDVLFGSDRHVLIDDGEERGSLSSEMKRLEKWIEEYRDDVRKQSKRFHTLSETNLFNRMFRWKKTIEGIK